MEEKARKRRDWIKNAAIIFLVAMLCLTFFSNTIMNYSLPEVSAQYSSGGNISSRVRGTATVEAVEPYKIQIEEKRLVEEVKIRTGDIIEKGQVLFVLGESDESSLAEAEDALDSANLEYQQKILNQVTEEDAKRQDVKFARQDYEKASKAVTKSRERAKEIKKSEKKITKLQKEYDELAGDAEQYTREIEQLGKEEIDIAAEQAAYDSGKNALDTANDNLTVAKEKLDRIKDIITRYGDEEGTEHDGVTYMEFYTAKREYSEAVKKVYDCQDKVSEAQIAFNKVEREFNTAKSAAEKAIKNDIAFTQELLNDANDDLAEAKASLDAETKNLETLKKDFVEINQAKEAEATAKRAFEKLLTPSGSAVSNLELETIKKKIERLEEKIEKLKETSGINEIVSTVTGVVSTVSYVAGETTSPENPLAIVELTDRGYTAKLVVTNEQSKLVQQGNEAEILNIWGVDIKATLISIKNDPDSQGAKKILTFQVTGDTMVGQTLELSVGERTAYYDTIVPNSAIREDNKGKFVLTVRAKSSPLGNRYIATRLDVEVAASDETSSAVTGSIMGSEFIIKTSTKPIEDGMQVRLVEGGNVW